ncbi:MAG: hypothetical protein WBG24_20235, partial [Syntrophobacteria bacterium]
TLSSADGIYLRGVMSQFSRDRRFHNSSVPSKELYFPFQMPRIRETLIICLLAEYCYIHLLRFI